MLKLGIAKSHTSYLDKSRLNLDKASMSLARKPFDCFDFDYKDSFIKTQNFLGGER